MTANDDLFRGIAEEAIMGIMVFRETDGQCVYINRLAREILEFPPEAAAETIQLGILQPQTEKKGYRSLSHDLLSLEGLMRDVLLLKSDGSSLVADLGIRHLRRNGANHFLIMFQDMTIQKKLQREITMKQQEIHQAYEELLKQNKQLKELDIAKDRFIALTTHELRTPLAAIFATSEVLKNKMYDSEEQRDEFIATVYEQATHLLELVNDILDFAKIQAGKMEFFVEEQDLNPCLQSQISNFRQMAENKKVSLAYRAPKNPTICFFDDVRLGEVISNVLNNAIKFTEPGGQVTVSVRADTRHVRVSIADTGIGIAPENVSKVFNEFETVGHIASHQKGTGLGMPISKRIMDLMGGAISLESAAGKGSTFHIDIPTQKVLADSEYKSRPEQADDLLSTV